MKSRSEAPAPVRARDLPSQRGRPARLSVGWWQLRRYVVPPQMIAESTARRLAGDWRGACAAANVVVAIDFTEVMRAYGCEVAERVADDLRHLVPDLLRWHPYAALAGAAYWTAPLADYGSAVLRVSALPMAHWMRPYIVDIGPDAPQAWEHSLHLARHLWDARHVGDLRERCGGDAKRVPFFRRDGTPLTRAEWPTGPRPEEPVAHVEWVTLLWGQGRYEQAWDAVGVALDGAAAPREYGHPAMALPQLVVEARRLAADSGSDAVAIDVGRADREYLCLAGFSDQVRASLVAPDAASDLPLLPFACWTRLPDLDLVRAGRSTVDELHPVVRTALFPGREPEPAMPELPAAVRVRCRGEWHVVGMRDGRFRTLDHTPDERPKMSTLDDPRPRGCFVVQEAWRSRSGWLPRILRSQRDALFAYAAQGDTLALLWFFEAGFDPAVRDYLGRTLMHRLHRLDHVPLLPHLLAAGLDPDAADAHGYTPLHVAAERGSGELVRALLEATGDPEVTAERHGVGTAMAIENRCQRDPVFRAAYLGVGATAG